MTREEDANTASNRVKGLMKRAATWPGRNLGKPHPAGVPLFIVSAVFFALLLISPFLAERDTLHFGSGGKVGELDNEGNISSIDDPFARAIYRFGDRYCHQKDHRSYELNGNQMPVCARDIGLFLGIFLGCVLGSMYKRSIPLLVLGMFILPMALDGGFQSLTAYESFNPLRLVTGAVGGLGIGLYLNGSLVHVLLILLRGRGKG
ncbi:MAG: DUF2085 domain-containing protein [Thermoplasmatota archaeon]